MSEKKGSLIPGIILIVIGCWFFLKRIVYLEPHWFRFYPLLIIVFSVFLLIETVRRRNSGDT